MTSRKIYSWIWSKRGEQRSEYVALEQQCECGEQGQAQEHEEDFPGAGAGSTAAGGHQLDQDQDDDGEQVLQQQDADHQFARDLVVQDGSRQEFQSDDGAGEHHGGADEGAVDQGEAERVADRAAAHREEPGGGAGDDGGLAEQVQ